MRSCHQCQSVLTNTTVQKLLLFLSHLACRYPAWARRSTQRNLKNQFRDRLYYVLEINDTDRWWVIWVSKWRGRGPACSRLVIKVKPFITESVIDEGLWLQGVNFCQLLSTEQIIDGAQNIKWKWFHKKSFLLKVFLHLLYLILKLNTHFMVKCI